MVQSYLDYYTPLAEQFRKELAAVPQDGLDTFFLSLQSSTPTSQSLGRD